MKANGVSTSSWGQRIIGLEGLRALAALAVVLYHVGHLTFGVLEGRHPLVFRILDQGLVLFFVLSGFLLFWPFASRLLEEKKHPPLRVYAVNRALRVYPATIVILTVSSFVLKLAMLPDRTLGSLDLPGYLLNLTLLQNFIPHWRGSGLEVAWTLTVELTFYALLPLMMLVIERFLPGVRRTTAAALPVVFVLVLGVGTRAFSVLTQNTLFLGQSPWGATSAAVLQRSFAANADLFALGMAAALVFIGFRRGSFSRRQAPLLRGLLLAGAVVSALFFVFGLRASYQPTAAAAFFACVLLLVVLPTSGGNAALSARFLNLRPIRYIGLISFSLYLWHVIVIRLFQVKQVHFGSGWISFAVWSVVVAAISIALASVTYFAVEKPALRLKRANRPLRADVPALAGQARSWNDKGGAVIDASPGSASVETASAGVDTGSASVGPEPRSR